MSSGFDLGGVWWYVWTVWGYHEGSNFFSNSALKLLNFG